MTEEEIRTKYLAIHDELTRSFYAGEMVPEDFRQQHRQNWQAMDAELEAEGYGTPPVLPPDPSRIDILGLELEALKQRVDLLEKS